MKNNYLVISVRELTVLSLLIFLLGISQNTTAFNPSYKVKPVEETEELKFSRKNKNQSKEKTTKKSASAFESTIQKTKKQKISFRKKLSILKLVLKNKHHNNKKHHTKKRVRWNGQHTAGLLSWSSVLVAVMAFFTGHFLLGILASCSAILFLLLIFVEKGNTGTVDDVLWIFSQIINIIVIIGTVFDRFFYLISDFFFVIYFFNLTLIFIL